MKNFKTGIKKNWAIELIRKDDDKLHDSARWIDVLKKKIVHGPISNVGVLNVGVFKRRSHQTSESQTSECSNEGVGQTSECSNVGVIIA